jgi:hypothetical protein
MADSTQNAASETAVATATPTNGNGSAVASSSNDDSFNEDLITKYPRSNRRMVVNVSEYRLFPDGLVEEKGQTVHISPYGLQFQTPNNYQEGQLLKIHVSLPDYWTRKQRFVEYKRIDAPDQFKILAKVVKSEDVGKRGKRKLVLVQTVNMDEVDEQVLKSFLQEV